MTEPVDFDNYVGFWIKDAPYLWAPGESPETSKRFYILHHNAAALFDENNYILDTSFIKGALFGGRLDLKETFSLLPIAHKKDCGVVRDHFLVWVFSDVPRAGEALKLAREIIDSSGIALLKKVAFPWTDTLDIRMEGKSLQSIPSPPLFERDMINIVNPETDYSVWVKTYDWHFGNPHRACLEGREETCRRLGGASEKIIFRSAKGRPEEFDNLFAAAERYNLTKDDLRRVHVEALKNSYADAREEFLRSRRKGDLPEDYVPTEGEVMVGITDELDRLGEKPPHEKRRHDRGWIYRRWVHPTAAGIIYDTAIGKRPAYIVRDPGNYGPERSPGTISRLGPPSPVGKHSPPYDPPPQTPKSYWLTSPVALLDKKLKTLATTEDLKQDKAFGDVVCFADDPNPRFRPSMEDQAFAAQLGYNTWFYAVLDGHGGKAAAIWFMKSIPAAVLRHLRKVPDIRSEDEVAEAIQQAFLEEDEKWFRKDTSDQSGATFTGVLVTPYNLITVNLGDSRTLIQDADGELHATTDHKPSDAVEKERIEAAGSRVMFNRVGGILAVARALGDNGFKMKVGDADVYLGAEASVSPVPEVEFYPRFGGEAILVACDGVFDVMSNKEAMDLFLEKESCQQVVNAALSRGTKDNVTAMGLKIPVLE